MTLPEKLDLLMKENGLNQLQLSQQVGIPYSTISNWYKDIDKAKNAKMGALKKLARYFHVSLDYLANDNVIDRQFGKSDSDDVSDDINNVLNKLMRQQDGLMFCGKPMDEETKRLLKISLENTRKLAIEMNKNKLPK